MRKNFYRVLEIMSKRWDLVALFVSFCFFMVNATYVAYPDEFVNLLGGVFINQGHTPYVGFFDHHLPLAWYLAAILLKLSFGSFVLFRLLWALLQFSLLALVGNWIKRNHVDLYPYYLGFMIMFPLMGVYFWFHLFLADSLAVLFFSLTFWLLIAQTLSGKVNFRVILLTSFLSFCLIFSSLTYLYLALALYAWQLILIGWNARKLLIYAGAVVAPYLLFALYILLSGAFRDFYFSNVTYNTELYISIPNYVRGNFFNPIKFGLTLIFNFHEHYLTLLSKIKHLDLYLPIGTLAGLGTLALLVLMLWRNIFFGALFFLVLSFSAPRSAIENYKETDYQGALFLVLGLISSLVAFYLIRKLKSNDTLVRDILRVTQFLLAVFMFFSFVFLLQNTYSKYFQRYTQKIPNVMNFSYAAQFIDQYAEDDYYWMGPYEPEEEFFVKKAKLPGKYPTLLPQFRENDHLKQTFIEQFENHPPRIIIFEHEASIFGTPAVDFGKFFLDWMSDKYTQVEDIKGVNVLRSPTEFNLKSDLYIRNNAVDSVLEKLRQDGYVE